MHTSYYSVKSYSVLYFLNAMNFTMKYTQFKFEKTKNLSLINLSIHFYALMLKYCCCIFQKAKGACTQNINLNDKIAVFLQII